MSIAHMVNMTSIHSTSQYRDLYDTTLSNGLRVVLLPDPRSTIISVAVGYKVGSKNEKKETAGYTHLFEHMMFQGSENIPDGKFDYFCSLAGGNNNAYTTYDKTVYYMVLPAGQLELALWLESDRMRKLQITEEKLQTQIHVILEEIKENVENRPFGRYNHTIAALAYKQACPYSWDPYGYPETLKRATLQDVLQFHNTYYGPNNAVLAIAGKFTIEEAMALVKKYFENIPPRPTPPKVHFDESCKQYNQYTVEYDKIPTPAVFLHFHCPGFTDSSIYAAELLAAILSRGMSSRLVKTLLYEDQLVSEVGSFVSEKEFTSLFTIYAIAREPTTTPQELTDAIWEQLQKLIADGITEKELLKAKNQVRTDIAAQLERSSSLTDALIHYTLFFNKPEMVFTLHDKFSNVTKTSLEDFARRFLRKDKQLRIDWLPISSQTDGQQK